LALGWRDLRWWRRVVAVLAIPMAVLCAAVVLNQWLAYLPTVSAAWDRLTGAPVRGSTNESDVARMQKEGVRPTDGTMVTVKIPDAASGFKHRDELVWLPPAWFSSNPPPKLPVIVMIHAEFGHPSDWIVGSDAQKTLDDFAAKHGGNAPVVVFLDAGGAFQNDTECVNGPRGNAADHITKDVVPYLKSHFGVSNDPANWGIVGWSSGGTCSVMLTAKYPELFGAFIDIDGQKGPFAGSKDQTIARLFNGNADAWAEFDPRTIMAKHGRYTGVSGYFAVSKDTPVIYRNGSGNGQPPAELDEEANVLNALATADYMCSLADSYGIECAVVPHNGGHDFKNAGVVFRDALPWLAGRIGTPGVPKTPLPGAPPA
jgi:S-formylglutathione hydrolase FrmB